VEQLFTEVSPCGPTPIGECLERVSHELLKDISKGKSRKKVNYIVITDGRPSELFESVNAK
jgi:Mg-chelatase subunit ChlD